MTSLRKEGEDTWVSLGARADGDAKKTADDITAAARLGVQNPPHKAQSILKRRADLFEAS